MEIPQHEIPTTKIPTTIPLDRTYENTTHEDTIHEDTCHSLMSQEDSEYTEDSCGENDQENAYEQKLREREEMDAVEAELEKTVWTLPPLPTNTHTHTHM